MHVVKTGDRVVPDHLRCREDVYQGSGHCIVRAAPVTRLTKFMALKALLTPGHLMAVVSVRHFPAVVVNLTLQGRY